MGTMNIVSDGSKGSTTLSVTFTPTQELLNYAAGVIRPENARLTINSWRGGNRAIISSQPPKTIGVNGSTYQYSWEFTELDIGWFRSCLTCEWAPGSYTVRLFYMDRRIADDNSWLVETGPVSVTGPWSKCQSCDGYVPPEEEEEAANNGPQFGSADAGDALPSSPVPPSGNPCLPASYVAPATSVPTPCAGGSVGSAPGFN